MAKDNPTTNTKTEQPVKAEERPAAPEVVSKAQYDAVVKQLQDLAAEANRRITLAEHDKKVAQDALQAICKLLAEKDK